MIPKNAFMCVGVYLYIYICTTLIPIAEFALAGQTTVSRQTQKDQGCCIPVILMLAQLCCVLSGPDGAMGQHALSGPVFSFPSGRLHAWQRRLIRTSREGLTLLVYS